jgi:hypothetical protein
VREVVGCGCSGEEKKQNEGGGEDGAFGDEAGFGARDGRFFGGVGGAVIGA